MSLSRNNKIWSVAESLLERLGNKKRSANRREQKPKKLFVDQLEERQLLSLTVASTENLLVNPSWQDIRGDIAVDSNKAGDVVVAWTSADRLLNPDYDANDPESSYYKTDENGAYVEDLNVYARYLTDEVQIVTIPQESVPGTLLADDGQSYDSSSYTPVTAKSGWYEVTTTGDDGSEQTLYVKGTIQKGTKALVAADGTVYPFDSYVALTTGWYEVSKTNADGEEEATVVQGSIVQAGSFELLFNANESQRFSIYDSGVLRSENDTYNTSNSISYFYIGLYAENELTWALFKYDANLLPGDNAANLQAAIRAIPGGEYSEVTVNAYSETDFDITFNGENWAGYDLPDMRVSNNYYADITNLLSTVKASSFDITDLNGATNFQKLILRDLFGTKYTTKISEIINTVGKGEVIRQLQVARDSLVDTLTSGVVTTVNDVKTITAYNNNGNKSGLVVNADPYVTAQAIQNAFNSASNTATLYAPITRGYEYNETTHRYEYTSEPTRAYASNESYGSMQAAIKTLEVKVEPVPGANNQFMITFTGASGLTNQDSLIVSAATSVTKSGKTYVYSDLVRHNNRTGAYEYTGSYDYDVATATVTVKESSEVFRVNSTEIAEFVIDGDGDIVNDREGLPLIAGTGRTNQYKPSVAVSNDGSFVITWVSDNPDSLQRYNQTDVYARRFTVQGYLPEPGEGGYDPNYTVNFYANGTTDGQLGYQPPETAFDTSFVADPFALDASSNVKIQCVAPVAAEFVVNASLNGIQTDPCVSADEDGNFIVTWTYIAQDNSYFGGIYGRQFNNEAQPTTGDITFASSQVSSNYYGPSYVAMSSDGFAVVTWNYGTDFYQSVLEPYNDVFIIDAQLVASNAYGSSVSFDYNDRYALAFTQEEADGVGGTPALPVTNSYVTVYEISAVETEPEDTDVFATSTSNGDTNSNNNTNGNDNQTNAAAASGVIAVGERKTSTSYEAAQILGQTLVNAITVGDQGNPSVGMDADGDVFVAYQGLGLDIQSITKANLANLYASDYDDLYIQLKWEDFENNNLCYKHKQFYRGNKYSYEDKNADLISFIQLALGWGYDELGNFTDNGATPIYQIHNYDCIDVDSYIRYFLSVAQKEGATTEQITRLDAVLETMLAPLRNNGYDVSYVNYGQTVYGDSIANANASTNTDSTNGNTDANAQVNIITDASVISGVVSSYRNGSNACFYLSLPTQYVSSGTLAFNIGIATARDNQTTNEDTCESVSFGIGDYFSNGFLTKPLEMADALSDALNALNMCAGEDNCFVVRLVPLSEIEFYQGTIGEIGLDVEQFQYLYKYTQDSVEYYGMRTVDGFVGLQITAQGSLHDTPLYIRPDYDATSLKLLDQASDDADYGFYTGLYVERYGELGNLQTNAHVANTSNGDVIVVWGKEANTDAKSRNDLYPNIGNSLDVEYSHVYLRAFTESTDTAGPIVTNTSLPNGQKVDDNQTVTSAVRDMVVSFSEDLLTLADAENAATLQDSSYIRLHAVDNVSNWYLLEDGVIVAGAIESVTFGLNASEQLARDTVDENGNPIEQINYGDLAYGTNRYEAVVHFADGFEPDDGNYTLVCSSMVQDTARNAIYSQGYAPDGSSAGYDGKDWALDFSVIRLNEALGFTYTDSFRYNDYIPVTYVHDTAADGSFEHDAVDTNRVLNQTTRSSIVDESSDYGPNTAQAIASNSNGDSVVVWVESEESVDASGKYQITKTVYARTYRALYVLDAEGNRSQVISQDKSEGVLIEVYSDTGTYNSKGVLTSTVTGKKFTDPRQASVAMDDKGEFCVVWDMYTDAQGEDGSRDVYMAKYAFNGGRMSINGNSTDPMRANVETDEDQQYAAVAMDSDGDIVVVWESYNQDGSGWGIYGRRFVTSGLSYGYQNTIQVLQFVGTVNILGDVLTISGAADGQDYTVTVPLSVEMRANATNIKAALVGTGLFTETDLEVAVSAAGEISIEYKGEYTATYVDMMEVSTNNPDLIVNVEMRQTGVAGTEFLVNQTTENNQRFAAIGMEPDGSFVVSWTSWGQDLDSDVESNIYARKFASNHVVSAHLGTLEEMTRARTEIGGGSSSLVDTTNDTSKVISTDSIEYHEVYPGQGYESVCMITVGETTNTQQQQGGTNADAVAEAIGTGSLLTSRRHVLTAAHVVCNDAGVPVDPSEELVYVTFETKSGTVYIRVSEIYVHPTYAGDPSDNQVDLAVLVLESAAPSSLRGYDLYTGSSEVGQTVTFVGYGTYGDVMDTDEEIANRGVGVKHEGQNVYELTGADFDNAGNPNTLIYDFDDGSYANDYLGNYYGVRNLGLGLNEAITAPGDSGSPTFINGQIAGVCSFGSDLEGDGAFGPGNYQVDVRVSAYADWINSVILSGLGDEFLVNTDGNIYIDVDTDDNTDNQNNNQNNNNNTQAAVDELTTDFWQRGSQIWSSVSMDGDGNFVITWTGYNQDGNGDAMTGGSNNGLGGVFMRVFRSDSETAEMAGTQVYQVNEYTAFDQIHSQVAMATNGNFVVAYESYQDPTNEENSDMVDNFGIYARRYALTSAVVTTESTTSTTSGNGNNNQTSTVTVISTEKVYGLEEVGAEFRVSRSNPFDPNGDDDDQLGVSVAVDSNGDMVFVWTDQSYPDDNIENVVCMRSITLPHDDTPPYVVRANAVYTDGAGDPQQVSLYANSVTFPSGGGPTSLVYSFNEYMFTAQMNADIKNGVFVDEEKYDGVYAYSDNRNLENKNVKSVIDFNDWTLTKDGYNVTSTYIYDILYGYNASTKVEDYLRSIGEEPGKYTYTTVADPDYATNSYELVILFKQTLPDGSYVLTLSDKVTDACGKNNLDGDYNGVAGGSFSVRWTIGIPSVGPNDYLPPSDSTAFTGLYGGEGEPVVVSNADGFIIVTEQQVLYELGGNSGGGSNNNNNNNNNNNTNASSNTNEVYGYYNTVVIDGTTYRIESDIVMRAFNSDGSPNGVETRVNSYSEGNQIDPDIDLTESGSYVITWIGESEDALNGVCARFYPGGKGQKTQIQIAGEHGTRCWDPDVCINEATGLVLITWMQGSKDSENQSDEMYGRFYDLNGNSKGAAFKIISETDEFKSIENFDVGSMTVNGAIEYVLVWEAYNESTKSFEVYQKTVTARENLGYYSVVGGPITQVNETTYRGQYDPQVATIEGTGEYYIVWVSDHVSSTGADIYARKYDASGASLPFMGTTHQTIVNTIVKNVQGKPDVAANRDGVVFVWESYDAEEFNYDSTSGIKEERHDYGVAARVFNAAGYPVYIDGYVYETIDGIRQVVPRQLGQQLELDEGEFIVNTTTAGNQFAPSVAVFDWDIAPDKSLYSIPRFVVAWAGPNPNAGEEIETDDTNNNQNNNGNNNNNNNNNNNTNATTDTSYIGPYAVFYKYIAASSTTAGNTEVSIDSKSSRYATDSSNSSTGGFYRPIGTLAETVAAVKADAVKVDSTTLVVAGTDADDTLVVTSANGAVAAITLNGDAIAIPAGTEAIYFDGAAGKDVVVYVASGREAATADLAAGKAMIVGEQAFIAANVEKVDATDLNYAEINARAATDVVNLGANAASAATAAGFLFNATGVAEVVAAGGAKATVVMAGTSGADTFVASNVAAVLTGEGYSQTAKNFATVRVEAGDGANAAALSDVDALTASDSAVIAAIGSQTIVAVGFEQIDATGTGSATASIYGTRKNDAFVSNAQSATMNYGTGATLNVNGFSSIAVDGRGGEDSAVLIAGRGANAFEGFADAATLTNGSFKRALANFSNVTAMGQDDDSIKSTLVATLHDTALDDAFAAYGDTATMDVEGANLYTVIAADQVSVKRDIAKGADTVDEALDLDFVFSVENWED